MMNAEPIAREILLLGGGHSHLVFLRKLGMKPVPGLRVTLVSPDYRTPYSGMLPGVVAGHYTEDEAHVDLAPLCRFAGAAFIQDEAIGLDEVRQEALCRGHPPIRYDLLSIDIGIRPKLPPGLDTPEVIPVKPISDFLDRWRGFLARQRQQPVRNLAVIGAGAGGVELLLAIQQGLHQAGVAEGTSFHCFTDSQAILPSFNAGVRRRFERAMAAKGITIHKEFAAAKLEGGLLTSASGQSATIDLAFLVTEAGPHPWLQQTQLAKDKQGFIQVNDALQSISHQQVFAAGDCATQINHPRPKAGVYAVRQGPPLFRNVLSAALGKPLRPFKAQQRFLSLISTGHKAAVATRNGLSAQGSWAWRWKDWIDRRFMTRFQQLPEMPLASASPFSGEFDQQAQCGGCGSKVSADLLREVLSELTEGAPPEDDASITTLPDDKLLLQSVDHFRAFCDDPYLLARIAVCHALSDIYACGGDAKLVHATVTLPYAKPAIARHLLRQVMAGTLHALQAEGVALAGGHTSYGQELSLGFTATGFVSEDGLWRKSGLRAGDQLLLTKPLGTGTLFAADMQGKAKGAWIETALATMASSNKPAMEALRPFAPSACTDVTGFGLAGHLSEMLALSGVGASISPAKLPQLEGAADCFAQGIVSSLHNGNQAAFGHIGEDLPLLYDPQTAGGLLAGLAATDAAACVQALHDAGYKQAAVIGEVTAGQGIVLK